jgi:hypothetical protein
MLTAMLAPAVKKAFGLGPDDEFKVNIKIVGEDEEKGMTLEVTDDEKPKALPPPRRILPYQNPSKSRSSSRDILSKADSTIVTTEDFLWFWAKALPSLQIHPDDAEALKSNRHTLALDTLVGPFMGPVRTAPVVLLTLNPGFSGVEQGEAKTLAVRELMAQNLGGDAPLPPFTYNPKGREWTERRHTQFGLSYEAASSKVAFVNLIPYRSKEGAKDMHMVERLESIRLVRAWTQEALFPEAEAGERVVVCLRSARAWGLEPDTQRGLSLFTPKFNRAGFMLHGPMREKVGFAVRRAVGLVATTAAPQPKGTALSVWTLDR